MIWKVFAVGRPSLAYARDGIAEYLGRIRARTRMEEHFLKPTPDVHSRLLAQSEGCFRILLDERGKQFTSTGFASAIRGWENRSISKCALLVGGSDGWDTATRERADLVWSLGTITLQHELALLVALEQIYRAQTINDGLPYHRE